MWKLNSSSTRSFLAIVVVAVCFSIGKQSYCEAFHAPSVDLVDYDNDFSQLNAKIRETLRYMEKLKSQVQPRVALSGQLNSRPARNDVVGETDHALRMHQLHELNRMFGAKARPRFGKRTEITLENVPTYGYEDNNLYRVFGSVEDRRR